MPHIRTDHLIDRLQGFALGDDGNAMSDSQIVAALALLDRALPDLHRIELTITDGQPISVAVVPEAASSCR